jgi:hypothetical protein
MKFNRRQGEFDQGCVLSESYTATDALPPILPACCQLLLPACVFVTRDTVCNPRLFFRKICSWWEVFMNRGFTELSKMTLGLGKWVADGSQGSCPMITSVHGGWFVRSIWTIMLMKEMPFSIELWQEMSLGCTIMNQRVVSSDVVYSHHVTRHNTPIHNILSTAPQLSISCKALGTLPEDGNVMPKHVGATIHN